jgi:hypothetical protein
MFFQESAQLTPVQAKQKFDSAVAVADKLHLIGNLKVQKVLRSSSASEMFLPKNEKRFNCIFEKESGRYWLGGGEFAPSITVYDTGYIASYHALYKFPASKQPELPLPELKSYADQALRLIVASIGSDTIDFARTQSLYSTQERQRVDAQIDLEAIRKTNGVPWGPGRWGKVVLVNFTGEVSLAMANRAFSRIEETTGVMSQDECSHYAAVAVLGIKGKECTQTSLIKDGGKFITGNPFLGGQYFNGNARAKKISDENLGVLAYEYTFGNGDAMVGGGYAVLYEVIVDARTGAPLRIQSPMAFGIGPGARIKGWNLPSGKVEVNFRGGKSIEKLKSIRFTKTSDSPKTGITPSTMQVGKSYWQVKRAGKKMVQIDETWYKMD